MSDVELVISPTINDDRVSSFHPLFPLSGCQARTGCVDRIRRKIGAEGDKFLFDTNEHLLEGVLNNLVDLEDHRCKAGICVHCRSVCVTRTHWTRHGTVEPLGSDENPATESERFTQQAMFGSKHLRVRNRDELVVEQNVIQWCSPCSVQQNVTNLRVKFRTVAVAVVTL